MTPEAHRYFAAALMDPEASLPWGLGGSSPTAPVRRFAVYRNNVIAGLITSLKARFPATCRIVGEEFFSAAARVFVGQRPPRTPVMLHYGEEFPSFLRTFTPARSVPYLADVAEVEVAAGRAYHAEDAAPIAADVLLNLPPYALPEVRLRLHPSLSIVRSAYPVVTLWGMNLPDRAPHPLPSWDSEDAIVARPGEDVEIRVAGQGEAEFLIALIDGLSLGSAADKARNEPGFDPGAAVATLFAHGLVVAATNEPEEFPQ